MKIPMLPLAVAALLVSLSIATAAQGWSDDYAKSLERAKAENKMVLLDFTGSDWCGWCKKLNREVFSTPKFEEYARANLVLVEIDFPRSKAQTDAVKAQNEALQQQYRIRGYPTIIVLNAVGKQVGQLGYMEGGPDAFIAELEKLKKS
jgi:protein disulfide-isomerase